MQQKKALIVKSFAVVFLSLSLATLIYAVLIQDIVQLQTRNIGFYLPISVLGSLTALLLLLASMLKKFKGIPASLTIYALSLPLGLLWSITEYLFLMSNMSEDITYAAVQTTYIVLPVLYAGVLCALAYYVYDDEIPQGKTRFHSNCDLYLTGVLILIVLVYAPYRIGFDEGFSFFFNEKSVLIILALSVFRIAISVYKDGIKRVYRTKVLEQLKDIGLVATLIGAAYTATFYTALSRLNDPTYLGPAVHTGISLIYYGLLIYSLAVTLLLNRGEKTIAWIGRQNWHIAEAYAFVLFVTFAPKSFFDIMASF